MEKLTQEMAKRYFEESGCVCPFCGSDDINASPHTEVDSGWAWRDVACSACGQTWKDEYRLTAISQDEDDFENEELIKALAKPKVPDFYNYAWVAARKNGWELEQTISRFSVCKKSEDEWCVHTIGLNCLVHGHYGFDAKEKAVDFALGLIFQEDLGKADVLKVEGETSSFWYNDDTLYIEVEIEDGMYELNINFEEITKIQRISVGLWEIEYDETTYSFQIFSLAPCGVEL